MAIDEDFSSTRIGAETVFVRDADFKLKGTWAGTASIMAKQNGEWDSVKDYTRNIIDKISFASITEVRVDFARTSGTLEAWVSDDALNRRS